MPAIADVSAGAWAVGVSGGADSTALLLMLHDRPDLSLHVVHLDHQLRGDESQNDARFVMDLAERLGLAATVLTRGALEPTVRDLPRNPSARYRAMRLALYDRVVRGNNLRGVILGHHADDQAETVLHRLLRNSPYSGLAGMRPVSRVGGLTIVRPLLGTRRDALRAFLAARGQPWREDSSNQSQQYARNRLRRWLTEHPEATPLLVDLAEACRALDDWVKQVTPQLPACFPTRRLADLPRILAERAGRRWLEGHGVRASAVERAVVNRLLAMARDAASPARVVFPGRIRIIRRGGRIMAETRG